LGYVDGEHARAWAGSDVSPWRETVAEVSELGTIVGRDSSDNNIAANSFVSGGEGRLQPCLASVASKSILLPAWLWAWGECVARVQQHQDLGRAARSDDRAAINCIAILDFHTHIALSAGKAGQRSENQFADAERESLSAWFCAAGLNGGAD
jgi:hypothetical protein